MVEGKQKHSPLATIRFLAGYDQPALSALSGVGVSTISRLEQGHRKPQRATARALAAALGVDEADLFPGVTWGPEGR